MKLVVGGGGFAPFLHDAVLQMEPGDEREVAVSPKDAFGECEWKTFILASAYPAWSAGSLEMVRRGLKVERPVVEDWSLTTDG